jgi:hypothetical protein
MSSADQFQFGRDVLGPAPFSPVAARAVTLRRFPAEVEPLERALDVLAQLLLLADQLAGSALGQPA